MTTQPLNQYLASLDSSRVGFPYTPLPFPMRQEPVFPSNDSRFEQQFNRHHLNIMGHQQDGIKVDTVIDNCPSHHKHHLRDFVVISLNNKSHAVNEAPHRQFGGKNSMTIYSTALPIKDSIVYKYGGRTDVTEGTVKDYTLVNCEVAFKQSSIVDNQSVNTKELRFRAWRVVSKDQRTPFALPGDLGSGVNNKHEQLVGQVHSGFCDGAFVPITYMNAIDEVFRDVEMKMPGVRIELSLPGKSLLEKITEGLQTGIDRIPWARGVLTAFNQMFYTFEPLTGDNLV